MPTGPKGQKYKAACARVLGNALLELSVAAGAQRPELLQPAKGIGARKEVVRAAAMARSRSLQTN